MGERHRSRGSDYLHRVLYHLDRGGAEKIHAHDTAKLIRAIEICLASRRKMTELWQQQGRDPLRGFRILRIGLDPDRNALYERINQRAQNMFEDGLIEETESLLQKYGDAARPLASLGYRQAEEFFRGAFVPRQAPRAPRHAT